MSLSFRFAAALLCALAVPAARAQHTFVVNDTRSPSFDTNASDDRCDVDAVTDGDQCTLALALAIAAGGSPAFPATDAVRITFNVDAALPVRFLIRNRVAFDRPVEIDGTTQPGYAGTPVVVIGQTKDDALTSAFLTFRGGGSRVAGIAFTYVTDDVLAFTTLGGNVAESNYIGLDVDGSIVARGFRTQRGIAVHSNGNRIGGPAASQRNVIGGRGRLPLIESGGNAAGVYVTGSGNTVQGNYIGLDPTGTAARPNDGSGVWINYGGSTNTITGNVIAGNRDCGVMVTGILAGAVSSGNVISGNRIGTNAAGTASVRADVGSVIQAGVCVLAGEYGGTSAGTVIGGTTAAARNLISGNDVGVSVEAGTTTTRVIGNYIGTDGTGTVSLRNTVGVRVRGQGGHRIGGATAAEGNVISGQSFGTGVLLASDGVGDAGAPTLVAGNIVGLDATGTAALPNQTGVLVAVPATVGVTADGSDGRGNVLSANTLDGLLVTSRAAGGVVVAGNRISTTADGLSARPNGSYGVEVRGDFVQIGGLTAALRNVIAGSGVGGVQIGGSVAASDVSVVGNDIGLGATGMPLVQTQNSAIEVRRGSRVVIGGDGPAARNRIAATGTALAVWESDAVSVYGNRIGFDGTGALIPGRFGPAIAVYYSTRVSIGDVTSAARANVIAGQNGTAVQVIGSDATLRYSSGVSIRRNSFYANTLLGIDLATAGRTANDAGDPDERDNRTINAPVITAAAFNTTTGLIDVTLRLETPPAAATFPLDVDVYLADADGDEGQFYLGTVSVGDAEWPAGASTYTRTASLAGPSAELFSGGFLVATVTDKDANTSEFSLASEAILPVELTAFTAAADGAGTIRLAWTTASETNNAGFAVEMRSATGFGNGAGMPRLGVSTGAGWREMAVVPGHGTTAEAHTYAVAVTGLAPGRYAFRLRQMDLDGAATHSAAVEATVGVGAPVVLAVTPNPARGPVRVQVAVREAQAVTVEAFDALGRRVATLYAGPLDAGASQAFALPSLPPGAYVVRIVGDRGARAAQALTVVR